MYKSFVEAINNLNVYYIITTMRQVFSHIRIHLRWYVLLSLFFLSIVLWSVTFHENRNGVLTVAFLDIGQGDSIFIESPTGVQVVIDGGPNKTLLREISKVMPWYDRSIDMIVVTNPDKDHYEGFFSLLKKYKTASFLESGTKNPGEYDALKKEIEKKKIPSLVARRGQTVDLGGGASLEILFPDRDASGFSSNDGSIVMRLSYGETSIMLQGDSTARIEEYLVSRKENLKATVLKVGHHGSKTSTTEEYVKAVDPEYAIISSGKNNSYGHPHKETLDTLSTFKVITYDTCDNGTITFESDGEEFILNNKKLLEAKMGCK